MDTLTELYNSQIVPLDEELEKQAAEFVKQAEEEDAAGRIMARGFADELNKLAMGPSYGPGDGAAPKSTVTMGNAGQSAGAAKARAYGANVAKSMFGGKTPNLGKGMGDFKSPAGGYGATGGGAGGAPPAPKGPTAKPMATPGGTIKSKPYATGGAGVQAAAAFKPGVSKRVARGPGSAPAGNTMVARK
jgi:hypothetical protein